MDDPPIGRRLPAVRLAREGIRRIGELRQAFRAFGDERRDQVAQHRRLAGAGRTVDGEQVAAGARHPDHLVDGELLPQRQWPLRRRGPAAEGDATRVGPTADLVEPSAHIDATVEIEVGRWPQVVAQGGAYLARARSRGHAGEVPGDEAVEEIVLDRVGARLPDDFAAGPNAGDRQHTGHPESLDRRAKRLGKRVPVEHQRLANPFLAAEIHLLLLRREFPREVLEAIEPAGRARTRIERTSRRPSAFRQHR